MLAKIGPMMLGMVVGYVLFFFITAYRTFDAKTLAATLGAVGGGGIIKLLTLGSDAETSSNAVFSYCAGVGLGFLTFGTFFLVLSGLHIRERITGRYFKFLLRSGGPGMLEDEDYSELFEAAQEWSKGKSPTTNSGRL